MNKKYHYYNRHNMAGDGRCYRHNMADDGRCYPHNMAGDGRCYRHNMAGDGRCYRHNMAGTMEHIYTYFCKDCVIENNIKILKLI